MLAGDQQIFLLYRISWTKLRFRQNSRSVNIQTKLLQNNAFSNIRCITAILKWLSKEINDNFHGNQGTIIYLLSQINEEQKQNQSYVFENEMALHKPKLIPHLDSLVNLLFLLNQHQYLAFF